MSDRAQLELKDLVLAVKNVTDWYGLGVQLSLPVYMLDTIKAERLPVQESMREMLNKWLLSDPEASWEKLASALDAIDMSAIAESIRRQFTRSLTSVVAGRAMAVDADDARTRQAMTQTILIRIRGDFSDLLVEVQSSLEEHNVKTKIVRKFLYTLFEGECSIPNVPDMDEVFDSVTKAKLWRFDHYGPLQVLAEKYLPDDDSARVKMAEYISQLSAYYATTSILDHLQASDQKAPEEDDHPISPKRYNRQYRKLKVKVQVDPSVKMEYVQKLWNSLMTEFNIPELTAVVDKIEKGSLSITWLVLPHIEKRIRAMFFKSVHFFQHHNIIEIELYDCVLLYDEEWMEGSTPLYRASFAGNIEEVKALLHKSTEDINQQNDNAKGHTPLIGACFGSGAVNIVRLLLEKGAGVDVLDKEGHSALVVASRYGHTEVVKLLLEYKADVNPQTDVKYTALIVACMFGNTNTITMLLAHGAVIDHREKGGLTPLLVASKIGRADTARVLLEKGATVDIKDNDGCTALWHASDEDHPETVKVLLEFGAEVDLTVDCEGGGTALTVASCKGHTQTVKILLSHGASVDYRDKVYGHTPLMLASAYGYTDTARALLEKGATVDIKDNAGCTALWYASDRDHAETVKVLLEFEAIIDLSYDYCSRTPLMLASAYGHADTARVLLENGANIDLKDKVGHTALWYARYYNHPETVKVLLEFVTKVDLPFDDEGRTPLMWASVRGYADTARALLQKGATVDIQDSHYGQTALMLASENGHADTARALLEKGATVDIKDNAGRTALWYASDRDHPETVKVLLNFVTKVDLPFDDEGLTPLMWASEHGHTDTARALLEKGATVDIQDSEGATALMYASYRDQPETVKVLLEFGAEVDLPFDYEDGGTALTVASREGHTQTVKVLLFYRALVDYQDMNGQTPLHHASVGGHVDTVTVLLEGKAKVDVQNEDGWTALLLAAKLGHDKVVKTLLGHGAFVDMKSKTGLTALDVARAESHQAVCEVIEQHLNQGAKVEPQQTGGQEDSESQDQVGESGQDSKTELTETGLTDLDVARAESHLNQGAKVEPQQTGSQEDICSKSQDQVGESRQDSKTKLTETGGQEDSESQDQVGESGQNSKTELTEEQRSEVRSVSERLWYQFKRVFLREVMEKKERTGQLQRDPSPRITDQPKGRKSILNLFNRPGRRRRRQTQRQVVGTAPVPERHQ